MDWGASRCGPCRMLAPACEAASEKRPCITFAEAGTEAESALAAAANITSIPAQMAFRDGVLVFSTGRQKPQAL